MQNLCGLPVQGFERQMTRFDFETACKNRQGSRLWAVASSPDNHPCVSLTLSTGPQCPDSDQVQHSRNVLLRELEGFTVPWIMVILKPVAKVVLICSLLALTIY